MSKTVGPEADVLQCMYEESLTEGSVYDKLQNGLILLRIDGRWQLIDERADWVVKKYDASGRFPNLGRRRINDAVRSLRSKNLIVRRDLGDAYDPHTGEVVGTKHHFVLTKKGQDKAVRLLSREQLLVLADR